jgi:integrase
MSKRRGNNEGSLYQRKDGLWCAQVSLDGRRLTKYAKTQKECRGWIKETITKIDGGLTFEATLITVERFFELWLNGKELSRRPGTVENYRKITTSYILPKLGQVRLQDITPNLITQLYLLLKEEGKGARSVQAVHVILHCALKQAVREGLLGRNPVDAVDRPRVEPTENQILTEEQARQLLTVATASIYETVFYLALVSGMRKGELLGLKWSDLDLAKGTIHVQRQLQCLNPGGYVLVPPKTKAGKRPIKLGQGMLGKLEKHRKDQELLKAAAGDKWQENNLIFTSSIGTFMDQSRISKEFKRLLTKAGLPDLRFHDLRHTSLSLLLENGTPVNTVQQRAGHSKASVTVDIYGHAMSGSQNLAADTIDELVTPIAVKLQ